MATEQVPEPATKRYVTGLALMVMAACSTGPTWLDLIAFALGAWLTLTEKDGT